MFRPSAFLCIAHMVLTLCTGKIYAQQTINVDNTDLRQPLLGAVNGEAVNFYKYVRVVEGSPYFDTAWMTASITTADGGFIKKATVKLNLLDNEVYYLDPRGKEMIATIPLKNMVLTHPATAQTWQFDYFPRPDKAHAHLPGGWLEMLYATKQATLYKYYEKKLHEYKPYGSAVTEQRITTAFRYYLVYQNQMHEIKKPDDLLKIAPEKSDALKQTMKDAKGKSDKDAYYTQLVEGAFQ